MTIREYLKRRQVRINLMSMPLATIVLLISAYATETLVANAAIFIAVFGYIASAVILMRRTPCLRCHVPLGNAALKWRSKRQPEPRCPQCGASFDEHMSGPS